ncbi:hypothetical protein [Pseudomonas sp. 52 E 6]|uniref:hypothetical protein n=1 Tax=Pseudomonas sp. 52 E 6 TaxID=1844106 RepID=UPI00081C20A2|nr:hypothetical protein [Pseudomonas sp. 52 E 6]
MRKFFLALYVAVTSVINAYAVVWLSEKQAELKVPVGAFAAVVVFLAFCIAFGRDKISEGETLDKLSEKDQEIARLKEEVRQKIAIIHSMRSRFANNVLTAESPEQFFDVSKKYAAALIEDKVINNVGAAPDGELDDYLRSIG